VIGNPIAQIFRERNVDISTQHLMRAIRLFIAEEEGVRLLLFRKGFRDRLHLAKRRELRSAISHSKKLPL
jgi:hypothetical protein